MPVGLAARPPCALAESLLEASGAPRAREEGRAARRGRGRRYLWGNPRPSVRRLRHRLVQRLVAVALLVGLGAAWAPGAEARAARTDAVALEAALDAAAAAPTLDAAAVAFAEAFVAYGGDAAEAPAIFGALVSQGFGAPDPLAEAFVPGRLAAPAPSSRTLAALAPATPEAPLAVARPAAPAPDAVSARPSARRTPHAPRAP